MHYSRICDETIVLFYRATHTQHMRIAQYVCGLVFLFPYLEQVRPQKILDFVRKLTLAKVTLSEADLGKHELKPTVNKLPCQQKWSESRDTRDSFRP